MYSPQQTQVYVPPSVVRGKVPRNAFGNLDIYVPSMVPAGGVHIRHPLTQQAARTLKIDYADAVTGFKFQGRHGTAIIEGAIIAQEHADAVHATIDGMENDALEDESRARSLLALRMWSRFLKGLRIAERVASYGDKASAEEVRAQMDREADVEISAADAGGFIPAEAEEPAMPTAGQFSVSELTMQQRPKKSKKKEVESEVESEGEYMPSTRRPTRRRGVADEDEDEYVPDQHDGGSGGGFVPDDAEATEDQGGFVADEDMGGGFIPDDEAQQDYGGGGFLPDDDEGGGFVPRANPNNGDDGGGGFIPEDDDNVEALGDADDHAHIASNDLEGGGFLPDADEDVRSAPDERVDHDEPIDQPEIAAAGPSNPPEASADPIDDRNTISVTEVVDATSQKIPLAEDEGEDAEDDRGSLLSHDPDDEDAEPDWLESD